MNNWTKVLNAARNTVGKSEIDKEPSSKWKKSILLAEHSPIRLITLSHTFVGIKSWISVHLVRHKIGIEHFVTTQRNDRTGKDRDLSPQNTPVNHHIELNAQALINISRKRLCRQSHGETREVWSNFLMDEIKENEPELYKACVPECVYRGFCPEMKPCGFSETEFYKLVIKEYRRRDY